MPRRRRPASLDPGCAEFAPSGAGHSNTPLAENLAHNNIKHTRFSAAAPSREEDQTRDESTRPETRTGLALSWRGALGPGRLCVSLLLFARVLVKRVVIKRLAIT